MSWVRQPPTRRATDGQPRCHPRTRTPTRTPLPPLSSGESTHYSLYAHCRVHIEHGVLPPSLGLIPRARPGLAFGIFCARTHGHVPSARTQTTHACAYKTLCKRMRAYFTHQLRETKELHAGPCYLSTPKWFADALVCCESLTEVCPCDVSVVRGVLGEDSN